MEQQVRSQYFMMNKVNLLQSIILAILYIRQMLMFQKKILDELFDAVLMTVKHVIRESGVHKEDIKLISFSAQMHSLIALDSQHERLTESMIWADNRANQYADLINEQYGDMIFINAQVHPFILCHHSKIF